MFSLIKLDTNIDFVGKRFVWVGLSFLTILAVVALFFTKGLNYGIDFTGGAEIKTKVPASWNSEKVREVIATSGLEGAKILQLGAASEHEFLIRIQQEGQDFQGTVKTISDALMKGAGTDGTVEIKSADIVGPSAGGLLRKNGILAALYCLIAILIYVSIRFDFKYAPGAVLALFHDTIIVLGIFIVFQKEFDLTVLAAILALIGYSNNDTIIVFDRVREMMKMHPGKKIEEIVNMSINQTLARTIMTSLTTFMTVVALYIFGGPVLEPFAFALMCGIVVGTYSSVFIASSMVIFMTHYNEKKNRSGPGSKKRRELKLSPEANLGL